MVEAIEGTNAYTFLDRDVNPPQVIAGVIIGILVMIIVVFLVVHFLILARVKITEERWGKKGKLGTRAQPHHDVPHIEIVDLDPVKSTAAE